MRLWELQLWERDALDFADEGEHVCYATQADWIDRIAYALRDTLKPNEVLRKRVTSLDPTITQDLSGKFSSYAASGWKWTSSGIEVE